MKYFFLFILLPLFSFAQNDAKLLPGLWVKVKAQMRDGSRMVDHNGCGMDFMKYNFGAEGMMNMGTEPLFEGFKIPYKLTGDSLVVGGNVYNVLGLTSDTLKLSFFALGADDNQLPVYFFAKFPENKVKATATYNAALKDSVYQASNELFPQCKGSLLNLMQAVGENFDNGTLHMTLVVDKKGKVRNYSVDGLDSISNGFAKAECRAFGDLSWTPAMKNNLPVCSVVQLTIKSWRGDFPGTRSVMNQMKIGYDFLPKAPYPRIDPDDFETSRVYFKDAINLSNNHNYDKALEMLKKCIDIDQLNLGAYYLRAMINAGLGKNREACQDWTTLAGLGQVDAVKKLARYCKN